VYARDLDLSVGQFPPINLQSRKYPFIKAYAIGINYWGRTYEEGKKIGWTDGFRALWYG
jgi:hypothetical protein